MYPSFTYIRTDKFIGKGMYEIKKNNFPNDRLIPEKQGRERGNKYISNVGLRSSCVPEMLVRTMMSRVHNVVHVTRDSEKLIAS